MTDLPPLDLRAEIARIDRDRAKRLRLDWRPGVAMAVSFTAGAAVVVGAIIAALHFI